MSKNYNNTIHACFTGYIVQGIVNNFVPLLFLTFQSQYGIPLTDITILITINFMLQLGIDLASTVFVDKIGYRASTLLAHGFAAAGLIMLAVLPEIMDPFLGLVISVLFYAVGGGLLEVIISPMVEACPSKHKDRTMSMLHSFYCWGSVGVILLSTLFFSVFGVQSWRIIAVLWAIVPVVNGIIFTRVPIATLEENGEKGLSLKQLFSMKLFWVFLLVMCCSGASELSISQWASTFAEKALGVSKVVGDIAGPTLFAVLMGVSRVIYGKFGEKIDLNKMMILSSILCVIAYLTVSLSSSPVIGLAGIAVSGFASGILWPGAYSRAAVSIKGGGTSMFALLALAGDLGCTSGPTFAGEIAAAAGDNLKVGILAATVFPALLAAVLIAMRRRRI